jgi:alpha-beta hydrolase superfamily lysophospholipase
MKKKANVPIWMVGTSMGSISAANVAINKQKKVSGLVLTSSVTRPGESRYLKKLAKKYPDGVAGMNLKKFKKPVLIVSH